MVLYDTQLGRRASPSWVAELALIAAASILLALSAKATVPFYPVPLSMQTFVVIGLGLALGPVRAAGAVLTYLAQGAAGLPVFVGTPENGVGLPYMMGPTGGFLIGFLVQAVVAGLLVRRGWGRSPVAAAAVALIAGAAIYPTGLLWLGAVIGFDKPVLEYGLYPFILGDIVKALLASIVFPMAWSRLANKFIA
jgi:biotin transport system substrate-specific component